MNILLYVITVIMLLTLTTYLRLENLVSTYALKKEFHQHLKQEVENQQKDAVETWYQTISYPHTSPGVKKNSVAAKRKISWFWMLNSDALEEDTIENTKLFRQLSIHLMKMLFQQDKDFAKLLEKNPQLLEQLLHQIVEINRTLPKEKRLKKVSELAALELENPDLNQALYIMMRGYQKSKTKIPEKIEQGPEDSLDEELLLSAELTKINLLNYITEEKADKIRIFLASRELLKVIYEDDLLVNDILKTRYELFKKAKQEEDLPSLNASFERYKQGPYAQILDFTVSKTNPKKYE